MKEDFLHFLWKHQKFPVKDIVTTQGVPLTVTKVGTSNLHGGSDFLDARILIDNLEWAGNVEIHIKSSDWYAHQHHLDENYDAVILHVVWEDDIAVMTKSGTRLPTLELCKIVSEELVERYQKQFLQKPKWIPCEDNIADIDETLLLGWKERLFIERLERKSKNVASLLEETKNNWEAVCFILLAKNFGLNINGVTFYEVAQLLPFDVLSKSWDDVRNLEALFLGLSNLLKSPYNDRYQEDLSQRFEFLKTKHQLKDSDSVKVQFNRLRPMNFPTIRWAQLAQLYASNKAVFSRFIRDQNKFDIQWLSEVEVSEYWKSHYVFGKTSTMRTKKLSKGFQDLLLINTLIPLKFAYERFIGNDPSELIFDWVHHIKSEKNNIITGFEEIKIKSKTALDSQSLIELKTQYCDLKKCLNCTIGYNLLVHQPSL